MSTTLFDSTRGANDYRGLESEPRPETLVQSHLDTVPSLRPIRESLNNSLSYEGSRNRDALPGTRSPLSHTSAASSGERPGYEGKSSTASFYAPNEDHASWSPPTLGSSSFASFAWGQNRNSTFYQHHAQQRSSSPQRAVIQESRRGEQQSRSSSAPPAHGPLRTPVDPDPSRQQTYSPPYHAPTDTIAPMKAIARGLPQLTNLPTPESPPVLVGNLPWGMMNFNSGHAASLQHMYNVPQPALHLAPNDRPFKCDQCPQSFNRNHDLKRHKRIHLAVKPFPCGYCDKSFSRKDALKRHILVKGCGTAHLESAKKTADDQIFKPKNAHAQQEMPPSFKSPSERIPGVTPRDPLSNVEKTVSAPVINQMPLEGTSSMSAFARTIVHSLLVQGLKGESCALESHPLIRLQGWNLVRTDQHSKLARRIARAVYRLQSMKIPFRIFNVKETWESILLSHYQRRMDTRLMETIFTASRAENERAVLSDQQSPASVANSEHLDPEAAEHYDHDFETDDSLSDASSQSTLAPSLNVHSLQKLMTSFCRPFQARLRVLGSHIRTCHTDQTGDNASSPPIQSSGGTGAAQIHQQGQGHGHATEKRRRDAEEDGEDADDDGNARKHPKRNEKRNRAVRPVKYACPFYKRNPARYISFRSCPGPGWDDVHRVKEHVYRCHALKAQCDRCGMEFDSDDLLTGHRRSPVACDVKNILSREGVSPTQKLALRSRRRVKVDESEEEKWYRAYGVLFPYDDITAYPTPYYELETRKQAALSPYHEFLQLEMPAQMQQQLALEMEQELAESPEGLDERLRRRLPSIVHAVHRRLYAMFVAAQTRVQIENIPTPESSSSSYLEATFSVPFEAALADDTLHQWFPMDESTFSFNFGQEIYSGLDGQDETQVSKTNSHAA